MVIRTMTQKDSREVAALSEQLGYSSSEADIKKRLDKMSQGADFSAYVAETADGRVVGWIQVYAVRLIEEDVYAEIGGLVVDTQYRGNGLAKGLLTSCEKWAANRGYSTVSVHSNMKRTEARPFYEKMGYNIVKTQYVFHKGSSQPAIGNENITFGEDK